MFPPWLDSRFSPGASHARVARDNSASESFKRHPSHVSVIVVIQKDLWAIESASSRKNARRLRHIRFTELLPLSMSFTVTESEDIPVSVSLKEFPFEDTKFEMPSA